MKNIINAVFVIVVCMSCTPDDATPELPADDNFDPATAMLLKTGMLEGVNHTATGTVSIFYRDGRHTVLLDPFESQNGPDLKVYFAKSVDASEYINLGPLKSTTGKQSYNVPTGTNIDAYPFVLIWCEKFTVIFAKSEPK